MTKDEYLYSTTIKNIPIDIGIDDYGQCYFFEYVDDNGELQSVGCGTYNSNFFEEICSYLDYKGAAISIYGKEEWEAATERLKQRYIAKGWDKEHPKDYAKMLEVRNREDYDLYNFEEMYRKFNEALVKNDGI